MSSSLNLGPSHTTQTARATGANYKQVHWWSMELNILNSGGRDGWQENMRLTLKLSTFLTLQLSDQQPQRGQKSFGWKRVLAPSRVAAEAEVREPKSKLIDRNGQSPSGNWNSKFERWNMENSTASNCVRGSLRGLLGVWELSPGSNGLRMGKTPDRARRHSIRRLLISSQNSNTWNGFALQLFHLAPNVRASFFNFHWGLEWLQFELLALVNGIARVELRNFERLRLFCLCCYDFLRAFRAVRSSKPWSKFWFKLAVPRRSSSFQFWRFDFDSRRATSAARAARNERSLTNPLECTQIRWGQK